MPTFLALPRELRDLIYTSLLTSLPPLPTPASTQVFANWISAIDDFQHLPFEPEGPMFAYQKPPRTVANMLAANRQINVELGHAIERARRKGVLRARMDCLVCEENVWFTMLNVPLVRTAIVNGGEGVGKGVSRWAPGVRLPVVRRLLAKPTTRLQARRTTSVECLQIDVRFGADAEKGAAARWGEEVSWAICAALKRLFEEGFDGFGNDGVSEGLDVQGNEMTVDTLVLNVVPTCLPARAASPPPANGTPVVHQDANAKDESQKVASELVAVWNKLWAGGEFKARYYRDLIEKMMRMRVCVGGVVVRERDLGVELERGLKERERIALRVGW